MHAHTHVHTHTRTTADSAQHALRPTPLLALAPAFVALCLLFCLVLFIYCLFICAKNLSLSSEWAGEGQEEGKGVEERGARESISRGRGATACKWHSKWQPQLQPQPQLQLRVFSIVVHIECDAINSVYLIDLPDSIIN